MATTGDGLESKDLQTMISDRNETAEMMVKRVWPRVDSWKVQWSKKLTSMRFKVRWHDDSPKGTITLSSWAGSGKPSKVASLKLFDAMQLWSKPGVRLLFLPGPGLFDAMQLWPKPESGIDFFPEE